MLNRDRAWNDSELIKPFILIPLLYNLINKLNVKINLNLTKWYKFRINYTLYCKGEIFISTSDIWSDFSAYMIMCPVSRCSDMIGSCCKYSWRHWERDQGSSYQAHLIPSTTSVHLSNLNAQRGFDFRWHVALLIISYIVDYLVKNYRLYV